MIVDEICVDDKVVSFVFLFGLLILFNQLEIAFIFCFDIFLLVFVWFPLCLRILRLFHFKNCFCFKFCLYWLLFFWLIIKRKGKLLDSLEFLECEFAFSWLGLLVFLLKFIQGFISSAINIVLEMLLYLVSDFGIVRIYTLCFLWLVFDSKWVRCEVLGWLVFYIWCL